MGMDPGRHPSSADDSAIPLAHQALDDRITRRSGLAHLVPKGLHLLRGWVSIEDYLVDVGDVPIDIPSGLIEVFGAAQDGGKDVVEGFPFTQFSLPNGLLAFVQVSAEELLVPRSYLIDGFTRIGEPGVCVLVSGWNESQRDPAIAAI